MVYNGKSYLKRVYHEKDCIRLVSINKDYDDICIDLPLDEFDHFQIIGVPVDTFTPLFYGDY